MCGIGKDTGSPYCILYRDPTPRDLWVTEKFTHHLPEDSNSWWDIDDLKCEVKITSEFKEQCEKGNMKISLLLHNYQYITIYWLREGDGKYLPEGFAINA